MSIQSDVELISVRAMEAYAKRNHMSGSETIELFHKHQVFEKIVLQHEYLHQYYFEEKDTLSIKRFGGLNREWLEFIKENRSKGGLQHRYDVVIGPVADDNTMETVQLYMNGILTDSEAVERLRYNKVNNQVSFHTEKGLESLKFVRRDDYE